MAAMRLRVDLIDPFRILAKRNDKTTIVAKDKRNAELSILKLGNGDDVNQSATVQGIRLRMR